MQRVLVVGSPGAGKTTMARTLAARLAITHIELDALHWGPDWTPAAASELTERVRAATAAASWVVDGNYASKIGAMLWASADTVVWMNPPRWLATWRCLARTVRRIVRRQVLWQGNRERWRGLKFWSQDSIIWWAWTTHGRSQARHEAAFADPAHAHLALYRLRTARETARFLAALVPPSPGD